MYSPTEGPLPCFQVLAVMTKLLKTFVCRVLCGYKCPAPLGKCQGMWLLDLVVGLCLVFQETAKPSSRVAVAFHFPTSNTCESLLLTSLPAFGVVSILEFGHSNRCVAVSHCYFHLHFSDAVSCGISHMLISHMYIFFDEVSDWIFLPFLNQIVYFGQISSLPFIIFTTNLSVSASSYLYKYVKYFSLDHWTLNHFDLCSL